MATLDAETNVYGLFSFDDNSSVENLNRSNEDGFKYLCYVAVLAYKLFDFLPTTLIEIAV